MYVGLKCVDYNGWLWIYVGLKFVVYNGWLWTYVGLKCMVYSLVVDVCRVKVRGL